MEEIEKDIPEQKSATISKQKPKYCRKELVNTTRVSQALMLPEAITSELKVYEFGENTLANKETYTILNLGSRILNMTDLTITPFDICILDCVYSMVVDGETELTIEQLANALMKREVKFEHTEENFMDTFNIMKLNAESHPHLSPEELDFYNFLHLSMHKLANIYVRLDCSNIKAPDGSKISDDIAMYGHLLPLQIGESNSPVKKVQKVKYKMLAKSILYQYAEKLNRVAVIPEKMLRTGLPATVDSVVLGREIAKAVSLMKNKNNNYHSRDIIYEWKHGREVGGLFDRIGLRKEDYNSAQSWSRKKRKIHEDVGKILANYQKEGTIKGYAELVRGKSKVGYRIEL